MTRKNLYLLVIGGCFLGYSWLIFSYYHYQEEEITICLLKSITGVACPSCGSTRAILLLAKGHLLESLAVNPMGILLAMIMGISPIWVMFDVLFNKSSALKYYVRMEQFIQRRQVAIPLNLLICGNWIWNILKGL